MDKPEPNFSFRLMALMYRLRDIRLSRKKILEELEIKPGFHVLDYGCGPGSYIIDTSGLVGISGKVYALDIHPIAIEMVQSIASKKNLTNVETIHSDCKTGLPDNSIDVVLLYDILHGLGDPGGVLRELHRVLKSDGTLSITDHHLTENEIVSIVADDNLFELSRKGKRTYSFLKEG